MFPFLRFSPRMPARCALPRCVLPLCALLLCTVACQRNPDTDVAGSADAANARSNAPAPSPATPAPATSPPPATVGAGSDASAGPVVARYACDAGVVLTRRDDGSYRAEIPGNPPVRLMRIANSTPPVYTGSSLYLRVGEGDAILSQGDRADELHCTAG